MHRKNPFEIVAEFDVESSDMGFPLYLTISCNDDLWVLTYPPTKENPWKYSQDHYDHSLHSTAFGGGDPEESLRRQYTRTNL